jgi:hypothetical protein
MNCKHCTDYTCPSQGEDFESRDCIDLSEDDLLDIDTTLVRTIYANDFTATMVGEPDEVNESIHAFCEELDELLQKYFGNDWVYNFGVEDD